MNRRFCIALLLLLSWVSLSTGEQNRRAAQHQQLLRVLPPSPEWTDWLAASGELAPDFDKLPASADLPDLLRSESGKLIKSPVEWQSQRQRLVRLFQHYQLGTMPLPPDNLEMTRLESTLGGNLTRHRGILRFGPNHRAELNLEVFIPDGNGPFPVLLMHAADRAWAITAVQRGYAACLFGENDNDARIRQWSGLFPQHDWRLIAQLAWAASRSLDYLMTLSALNHSQIVVAGHGRNGIVALVAGALDDRFRAVISSNTGPGGITAWRHSTESRFRSGIETVTREHPDWFHPRLRFFTGREHRLPIDQHLLLALVAPRPLLITAAIENPTENIWGIEQSYFGAVPAFNLTDSHHDLNVRYHHGREAPLTGQVELVFDWLDTKLGRKTFPSAYEKHTFIFPAWLNWAGRTTDEIDPGQFPTPGTGSLLINSDHSTITLPQHWLNRRRQLKPVIEWFLGEAPPGGVSEMNSEPVSQSLKVTGGISGVVQRRILCGNLVAGNLYHPESFSIEGTNAGLIILVSPMASASMGDEISPLPLARLLEAGYSVAVLEPIGVGSRIKEIRNFYERYSDWSLMGKMIRDIGGFVDAIMREAGVKSNQIILLGLGDGADTALHAAAFDKRITGVIAVGSFTRLRTTLSTPIDGGLQRLTRALPLLPRLGAFIGSEEKVPYDYPELIATIAPRNVLLVTPEIDEPIHVTEVQAITRLSAEVYGLLNARESLKHIESVDFNRLSDKTMDAILPVIRKW